MQPGDFSSSSDSIGSLRELATNYIELIKLLRSELQNTGFEKTLEQCVVLSEELNTIVDLVNLQPDLKC